MTRRPSPTDRRDAIDRRIDRALPSTSTDCLEPAREQMAAFADRWYGRLVSASFEAGLADDSGPGATAAETGAAVTGAAAAVELLRGYCSLRHALLLRDGDDGPRERLGSVTPRLLAGDYLFAAAFERLGEADGSGPSDGLSPRSDSEFETLARTAERSIEAMAARDRRPTAIDDYASLIADTAGELGWWAARTGAILAGVPADRIGSVAAVGRAASVHRQLRHVLDPTDVPGPVTPFPGVESADPTPARDELRRRAERRRDETAAAIESLPAAIDAAPLHPLVRADRGTTNGSPDGTDRNR